MGRSGGATGCTTAPAPNSGYAGTGLPGGGLLKGGQRKEYAGPIAVTIAVAPPHPSWSLCGSSSTRRSLRCSPWRPPCHRRSKRMIPRTSTRAVLCAAPDCRPNPRRRPTHQVWCRLCHQPMVVLRCTRMWAQRGRVRVQGGPGGVESDIVHHCPPATRRKEDLIRHSLQASQRQSARPVRRPTGLGPTSDGRRKVWSRCTRWMHRHRKAQQKGRRKAFQRGLRRGPRATACSKFRHS